MIKLIAFILFGLLLNGCIQNMDEPVKGEMCEYQSDGTCKPVNKIISGVYNEYDENGTYIDTEYLENNTSISNSEVKIIERVE